MRLKGSLLFSLLMLVIFCGMLVMSMDYSEKARFVPLVVGIPGFFLSFVQVVIELRAFFKDRMIKNETNKPEIEDVQAAGKELSIICWTLFLLGLILVFGFWVAIPVFLILFLRYHGKESWVLAVVCAACGWGVIFIIFYVLVRVPLYGGLLGLDFM